jgi:hypothetical protein
MKPNVKHREKAHIDSKVMRMKIIMLLSILSEVCTKPIKNMKRYIKTVCMAEAIRFLTEMKGDVV